ncbi:hypothetical protein [Fimbriiglobus ruber]|uniref:Putative chaperonin n=1 Tax=Fimbriiglobus ruber TaxID=1908690 RepID=A0A225DJ15_9BACT|nr:hypothetical protein [Fimbriiglobus ruber]OWK36107.1 putative chaperonin [Fimbriiglobus ruber]
MRAARNLAAAFDAVHSAGCLIGDVQMRNAHVSPQAIVRLVDCDSFQVRAGGKQYLCEVGLPHYIPPELQGRPLRGLVRAENHDRFGLAVLIFQLLFVGRHPYAGVYSGAGDPPFEQLIAEFRFAHGPAAGSWGMAPPPHTPALADVPPEIGTLFRRAFERGSEADARPRAAEWVPALQRLEQSAVECAADAGHKYWPGARGCVWCRLAATGGPEYYFGVADIGSTFVVDEDKLRAVQRRLAAVRMVDFPYERAAFFPATRPAAEPLPDNGNLPIATVTIYACLGLGVIAIPVGIFYGVLCFIGMLCLVLFGVALAAFFRYPPDLYERSCRQRVHDYAYDALFTLEWKWKSIVGRYRRDHTALGQSTRELIAECMALTARYRTEMARLSESANAAGQAGPLRVTLPAERGAIVLQFRKRHQQILTRLDQQVAALEMLAPACRAELDKLGPEIKKACAEWEQAEVNLRVVTDRTIW